MYLLFKSILLIFFAIFNSIVFCQKEKIKINSPLQITQLPQDLNNIIREYLNSWELSKYLVLENTILDSCSKENYLYILLNGDVIIKINMLLREIETESKNNKQEWQEFGNYNPLIFRKIVQDASYLESKLLLMSPNKQFIVKIPENGTKLEISAVSKLKLNRKEFNIADKLLNGDDTKISSCEFSSDGNLLVIICRFDIILWNILSGQINKIVDPALELFIYEPLKLSNNAKYLARINGKHNSDILNLSNLKACKNQVLSLEKYDIDCAAVFAFSFDNKYFYEAKQNNNKIIIWYNQYEELAD